MKLSIQHPDFPDLEFEATYFPPSKGSGEYKYSLGEPPESEFFEVTKIFWHGQDVTEFCIEFCDNVFEKFSEDLRQFKKDDKLKEICLA